jgi:dipeptidyl aminopeptidase/acylaminoacyl peptidase
LDPGLSEGLGRVRLRFRLRRPATVAVGLAALLGRGAAGQAVTADREAMYQRYLTFPERIKGGEIRPRWLPDGNGFWYSEIGPGGNAVYRVDPAANRRAPMFDVDRLRRVVAPLIGAELPERGLPFTEIEVVGSDRVRFSVRDRWFELRLADYGISQLESGWNAERIRATPRLVRRVFPSLGPDRMESPSPDRRWLASFKDGNLWLRSTFDTQEIQITDDAVPFFGWDGAAWSPDGSRLAVMKHDNRAVNKVPIVHWLAREEQVEWLPWALAGGALPRAELHVLDVMSKRLVRIAIPDSGSYYLNPVGWMKDGSTLIFTTLSRDFKRMVVYAADPAAGSVRALHTETQKTFIKGIAVNPGYLNLVTPLEDSRQFLLISERDGWDHLYLYSLDGTLVRRLTTGQYPVLRVSAVDLPNGWVYFTAHGDPDRPYDTHVYRVSLAGGPVKQLTEAPGHHDPVFSPSKAYFLDTHSSLSRPPAVDLRKADGSLVQVLATADTSGLRELRWRPPEPFKVKAADGVTDLYGILIKPFDFDSTKKYPIIEDIYGGPLAVRTPRMMKSTETFFGIDGFTQAVAQLGFVVVMVDGRGTPERGKAFQDVVYGALGKNEIPDHVAALRNVAATRPYLDLSRVGVTGVSYGGYFTIRAMVLAPDLYKVGVARAPAGRRIDGPAGSVDPYLRPYQEDPAAWEYGTNERFFDRLTGKLLMIIGTSDINTPFSGTIRMLDALARARKPYSLMVLPEANHAMRLIDSPAGGDLTSYWRESAKTFFVEHLKPGS